MAGRENIEDDILSSIEESTGTPWETPTDDTGDTDDNQDQVEKQLNRREPRQPQRDQSTVEDDENLTDPLEARRKQPGADDKKKKDGQRGKPSTNEEGNLVDEQGQVVAKGGRERRLFYQLERTRDTVKSLEQRNAELARQLADNQHMGGLPSRHGLSNDDLSDGLPFLALYKTDPKRFAQEAVTRAVAKGVALQDIVSDEFIPNVSIAATQRLLDERLGPIAQRNQQDEDSVRAEREATESANRFLSDYPDAAVHSEVIAFQMDKLRQEYTGRGVKNPDPYLLAERAWTQLEQFARANQLDLTQPLGPQIEARRSQPRDATTGRNPREQQRRPMPNGSGGGQVVERKSRSANADDSYDSIVKQALSENGLSLGY